MLERNKISEDEIDLIELIKTIWAGRGIVIKVILVFIVFGLITAFSIKVEYKASCKLLPERQEGMKSSLGGLSGLAGLAGINLDISNSGSLSPELYPLIVQSLPSQLRIINDTLDFESKKIRTSSFDYFRNYNNPSLFGYISKYTIGLPGLVKSLLVKKEGSNVSLKSDIYRFTKEEKGIMEAFKERIEISIDPISGLIYIAVEMPDALAAAQLTNSVVSIMTQQVTEYKIEKVRNNLNFIQNSYSDAELAFKEAQKNLAIATDRNKHLNSAAANIKLQSLQNEYNLAFEIFKGLAIQLEQAKIKLKEETPVFTVLEPVRIPEDKSKPRRALILIVFIFIGGACSCGYIVIKQLLSV